MGALTFAFTDIEGSTARWERDRAAMQDAVRRHDAILRTAIERHGGRIFKTIGDAFCSVFDEPSDAVEAMVEAQQRLVAEDFSVVEGLRVRAAIHTGSAEAREDDYFGPAVNKVARLLAIGHGGQVLLTDETARVTLSLSKGGTATLRDLGTYHLKDFAEPQRVHQVVAPGLPAEFPPLRSLGTLPSDISIVDTHQFHPVATFSGREDELTTVHRALARDGAIAIVHGLGGVGKSSIAREYGWRNRDSYSVAWWLDAESEDGIIDGLLRLGAMFVRGLDQLADRRAAAQRVINSVLGGFDKPALLVFDNLENEMLMRTWLPRTARALATSRDAAVSGDVVAIPLQIWSLDTAVAYLQRASARADLSEADARAIAQALGTLPLAMAHAAAALRNLRMVSPQRYLEHIAEHLKKAPHGAEYPRSVFATFSTAITQAEQHAPGSATVLSFAASFAPDAIPDELFRQPAESYAVPELRSVLAEELRLDEILGTLDRLSLLEFAAASRTYRMHRLVQLAAKDLIGDAAVAWRECAVAVADAAFPEVRFEAWQQCERLLPHARAALDALPDAAFSPAADLANHCGLYLFERGDYGAARLLHQRALAICEASFGAEHPAIVKTLNRIANSMGQQDRYAEAETLYRRALETAESMLDADHPDLANTLNNLSIACRMQGRLEEAEALQKRSIAIKEKLYGEHHPTVAVGLNNLALGYREQGRYEEAETLNLRALAIREAALRPDDPWIALNLHSLAALRQDQGRYDEAEALLLRALAIYENAGPEHPMMAEIVGGLGSLYEAQGRTVEAQSFYARELAIRDKSLDQDHPRSKAVRDKLQALCSKTEAPSNS